MNEDTLDDEVKNFSVDVEENSKVELEDPNEFIEVKVKSNVVNLLFEGTFEENTEEILENLDKFPEPEIEVEEVTFHKHGANVSKLEPEVETNSVEAHLDDILNGNLDESQDIPEDDAKAKVRNDASVVLVMNVVPVGDTKNVSDETVLIEPELDDTAAIAENILTESENKVKAEEELDVPASSSKKAVRHLVRL